MQRGAWRGGGPEKDPSSRRPQEWASVNPELSLGVRLVVPRRASQVLRWWLSDPGGRPPAGTAPSLGRTVCRVDNRAAAGRGFAGAQRLGLGQARPESLSARGRILILSSPWLSPSLLAPADP